MDFQKLKAVMFWCMILNGGLLAISTVAFILNPDFIFQIHGMLFAISRDAYDAAIYNFLGLFKIIWLTFNVVPYIALRIAGNTETA